MLPFDNRRSSVQLVGEILGLLRLGDSGKTEVMYAVRLSHLQTGKYLGRLIDLGLIRELNEDSRHSGYRITPKGLDLLSKIEHVQETLQREEIPGILDSPEFKVDEKSYRQMLRRIGDAIRPKREDP